MLNLGLKYKAKATFVLSVKSFHVNYLVDFTNKLLLQLDKEKIKYFSLSNC